jgi:acyl-CoA synthetase (AMP-forming)/AMP-acid ligase II
MLLHEYLYCNHKIDLDKISVYDNERQFHYHEVIRDSKSVSAEISSRGLTKGDKVVILLENSYEFVISLFGILSCGCVFIPVSPKLNKNKINFIIEDTQAALIITSKKLLTTNYESILKIPFIVIEEQTFDSDSEEKSYDIIDCDIAAILYTSGSTGMPKGVTLSHLNMVTALKSINEYLRNTESEIILNLLPFSFDYGLYQIFLSFFCGGTLVIHNDIIFFSRVIETIKKRRVTAIPIVPAIGNILLKINPEPKMLESIRYITNTAQRLPGSLITRLKMLLPEVEIYSMYGLTECKRISYLDPEKILLKPGSVGKPMPNVEVFLVDEEGTRISKPHTQGQLVVRGSNVMMGYWNNEEETNKILKMGYYPMEKVLFTGDIFEFDKDGDLYFIGRKDNIFKVGGQKVSPAEIEKVLLGHYNISEAAVIKEYDEILGNCITAIVVIDGDVGVNDINIFLRDRLEDHLIPKRIHLTSFIPKNSNGKIDKMELVKKYAKKAQ